MPLAGRIPNSASKLGENLTLERSGIMFREVPTSPRRHSSLSFVILYEKVSFVHPRNRSPNDQQQNPAYRLELVEEESRSHHTLRS